MKKKTIILILCGVLFITGTVFISVKYIIPMLIFGSISQSHIDGNVPSKENFNVFLQRDLTNYFSSDGENIRVEYELLRDKPTQVGTVFPKYYAWVEVYSGDALLKEGAVRISAIDKEEFGVNDFVSKQEIIEDDGILVKLFPSDVCEKINLHMNGAKQ